MQFHHNSSKLQESDVLNAIYQHKIMGSSMWIQSPPFLAIQGRLQSETGPKDGMPLVDLAKLYIDLWLLNTENGV